MKKVHLTGAKEYHLNKTIEAHGKREGDYWEYEVGWDDQRVADEVGVAVYHVSKRRRDIFGDIRSRAPNKDGLLALAAKVETLELGARTLRVADYEMGKRVEALEKALNILLSAPNRDGIPKEKLEELRNHFAGRVVPTPRVA